jgi:glycosyltransferase involved in cell wall biosynthesis
MTKKKLLIMAAANNFHFIKDIANNLSEFFDVEMFGISQDVLMVGGLREQIDSADVIWFEWADGLNMDLLMLGGTLYDKKIILRLHRYELFTSRTLGLLQQLTDSGNYKKIDKLVFVSEFVRQIGISEFSWMAENSVVIPNLIDHTKFPFTRRDRGYNLLFLGRISYVKNLPLCLTMFHELLKLDSNYKLHIVGEISDPELRYYLWNFASKNNMLGNIITHGRIAHELLPDFMKRMNYVVCSSIFEAHPVGIIEGMATGLKPVVFNFPGAEKIYPEKWLWTDRTDFINNILSHDYNPQEYHDYVMEKFSIQENIERYKNLIEEL